MVDYVEAIKKPFTDLKTMGIGAILGAIPLVNLLVSGYGAKTAQEVTKNNKKLLEWKSENFVDYLIKAIFIIIIQFAYTVIPVIIILIGLGSTIVPALTTIATEGFDPNLLLETILPNLLATGVFVAIGGILLLIVSIFLPAAIIRYLRANDIKAAFDIGKVAKNVLTADYLVTLIILMAYSMALGFVVGIIGTIIALIPIIGAVLMLLVLGGVSFVTTTTHYTLMAQVVKE